MRLVTFTADDGVARPGAVVAEKVVDLASSIGIGSLTELITGGESLLAAARAAIRDADRDRLLPLDGVTLEAPLRPAKIIGVGLNYSQHVDESARSLDTSDDAPERPVLFSKPATAVVGPEAAIRHDAGLTAQLDWEVELGVVIGRTATRVKHRDAFEHVFGYTIVNDISARDQRRGGQWFFSKAQDSFAPIGPAVVTADEIEDPHALDLGLRVNGVVKQSSNTSFMLFKIPELIADISSGVTLEPGDVIATGSPSGVGAGRTPPEFLVPGDTVEAEVRPIGILRNYVVDVRALAVAR